MGFFLGTDGLYTSKSYLYLLLLLNSIIIIIDTNYCQHSTYQLLYFSHFIYITSLNLNNSPIGKVLLHPFCRRGIWVSERQSNLTKEHSYKQQSLELNLLILDPTVLIPIVDINVFHIISAFHLRCTISLSPFKLGMDM